MSVHWGNSLSDSFKVSNGVRQGSVLSPVLFSEYLDGLLGNWVIVVLIVIGVVCLLELFVMQMILFCWPHVHLH